MDTSRWFVSKPFFGSKILCMSDSGKEYASPETAPALFLLRHSRRLTQAELAALAGISRESVGKIERGDERPRRKTAQKLAVALGWPVETVFPDQGSR